MSEPIIEDPLPPATTNQLAEIRERVQQQAAS